MLSSLDFDESGYFCFYLAKRGLPWHVTHVIRVQQSAPASASSITSASLSNKRLFQHRTFVHMFDQCTQNARAVTSILADIFKRLKAQGTYVAFDFTLFSSVDQSFDNKKKSFLTTTIHF